MLALAAKAFSDAGHLLFLALCWMGVGVSVLVVAICAAELWMYRRGFASWREIARGDGLLKAKGDPGLLRQQGCVLGAVRRHALSQQRILRASWGRTLFLGEPELVNAALRAAVKDWDGALVFVGGAGGVAGLGRDGAVRISPGTGAGASYNPMLAIRTGPHAFGDAQILASALLQSSDARLVQPFAALILDQLYTAPLEERNLAALRRRLFDAPYLFDRIAVHVHVQMDEGVWRAHPEIRRIAQICAADPKAAQAAVDAMRKALAPFGDGRLQEASNGHQVDLGDLIAGDEPRTLILEVPAADPHMASYCAALLAQLVAVCTDAQWTDHRGRRKRRSILLVIDDAAALGFVSLLQRKFQDATRCGLFVCIGARDMEGCARLLGLKAEEGARAAAHFEALAAIGPQRPAAAASISHMAGGFDWFDWLWPRTWRDLIWPRFSAACRDYVETKELERAAPGRALVFAGARRPIWAKSVLKPCGRETRIVEPHDLPEVSHDWMTAPPPFETVEVKEPEPSTKGGAPSCKSIAQGSEVGSLRSQGELALSVPGEMPSRVTSSNKLRQALSARPARDKRV